VASAAASVSATLAATVDRFVSPKRADHIQAGCFRRTPRRKVVEEEGSSQL
jgi:hypothetical protein